MLSVYQMPPGEIHSSIGGQHQQIFWYCEQEVLPTSNYKRT